MEGPFLQPSGSGSVEGFLVPHGTKITMKRKTFLSQHPITSKLLRWYARHSRDLPWRRTRDPYSIWISEVMLQQTQVETVIPYYRRFLARFPSVKTLAEAHDDEVLKLWENLGYYSRARNLHDAAREIAARWQCRLPHQRKELLALPEGHRSWCLGLAAFGAIEAPANRRRGESCDCGRWAWRGVAWRRSSH